ncbi:Fic family protein [Thalassotalea sp. ND16A]|uniref:Fic family protein n=1 Tax=Thalassotalea sp. ND16A TaxID=1535422 RepID=UPI00051A498C|nr:Fic family protein [Thalassotalea sp. ND16A]KGJ92083.1 hypothetical protein ND16A_1777 [Thalassotalea sp. ND16A]
MYKPPFTLTSKILSLVADISEAVGRLTVLSEREQDFKLRRVNRIRTIQGSLAIEGNTLSTDQITAILDGKRVIAPLREVKEAHNALAVYERLADWQPSSNNDLLAAHRELMLGLVEDAGMYRQGGVGVMSGDKVVHMAPQGDRVPKLMADLLAWLESNDDHPLIASCVFHYEFEFIHPFSDGNGRMGRLWQSLLLSKWNISFVNIPVESLIHQHQGEYYQAINQSTIKSDSAPFIEFMLVMILDAINSFDALSDELDGDSPQVTPQVSPQVKNLVQYLNGDMGRDELQKALGLSDRKSFRERYIKPALENGIIEMTKPDKPNSRLQKYRLTSVGKNLKD